MRSSQACSRCRRSKIRCANNGVGTTCRACQTTGRECIYPSSAAALGDAAAVKARRGSGSRSANAASDTHRRPARPKKSAVCVPGTLSSRGSSHPLVDALDLHVLTPKVWTDLSILFQAHYNTEFPFLHPPSFLKPLLQASQSQSSGEPSTGPLPGPPAHLLLAFLALTSRFHPQLIAHHSPSSTQQKPQAAADYYASACRSHITNRFSADIGAPDLQCVQAMLMLGFHDWGSCRGSQAWVTVGMAIRCAQLLGLQFEPDPDDTPLPTPIVVDETAHPPPASLNGDTFIEQETRRRTFWSCFIMDRYLSSGRHRPQMLSTPDIRIQLPCSERAFLFGERVKTQMLGEERDHGIGRARVSRQRKPSAMFGSKPASPSGASPPTSGEPCFIAGADIGPDDEQDAQWDIGPGEGVLGRFIKILDLHNRVVEWSCGGGRRREQYPPWDDRSSFSSLQQQHSLFGDTLPRDMTLTSANNISAHITSRTSTPFVLMHALHLLDGMILHREYLPFIPLRSPGHQGPVHDPVSPSDKCSMPDGYWEQSARQLFKSTREVIELLRVCQEWNALVETPIVGFAAYLAALNGVYAINFPWMDPDGYMCKGTTHAPCLTTPEAGSSAGAKAARDALGIIGQMRRTLPMAEGWFETLKRVHAYHTRAKGRFRRYGSATAAPSPSEMSQSPKPSISGTSSGGEEERLLERSLREFAECSSDLDMLNAEEQGHRPGWNAINTMPVDTVQDASSNASPHLSTLTTSIHQRQHTNATDQHGARQPAYTSTSSMATSPAASAPEPPCLDDLNTHFGADDVAAFVAGARVQEWVAMMQPDGQDAVSGWLTAVWAGAPGPPPTPDKT